MIVQFPLQTFFHFMTVSLVAGGSKKILVSTSSATVNSRASFFKISNAVEIAVFLILLTPTDTSHFTIIEVTRSEHRV